MLWVKWLDCSQRFGQFHVLVVFGEFTFRCCIIDDIIRLETSRVGFGAASLRP
jgi:hypothetical protein